MKIEKDGNMYCVHPDRFVNLQESTEYFFIDEDEYQSFLEKPTKTRLAPHGSGGPNDDIVGQRIVAIARASDGGPVIHLSNGMEIYLSRTGRSFELSVLDAGAWYPLKNWESK